MNKLSIWKRNIDVKSINANMRNTMMSHIGIKITKIGENYILGTMPVNNKTKQPFGILHGGASVTLAESLGSLAANLCLNENKYAVGLEINANHIKGVKSGIVEGKAQVLHLGRTTQVWEIKIHQGVKLTCSSRLTMAIIEKSVSS
ncbi:MAG: thioesterase [Rickettsiales bacterium]|nr:thioesterase [Rickettsiales bacterium]